MNGFELTEQKINQLVELARKLTFPLVNCFKYRRPFRTVCGRISGIFYIAAAIQRSVF